MHNAVARMEGGEFGKSRLESDKWKWKIIDQVIMPLAPIRIFDCLQYTGIS